MLNKGEVKEIYCDSYNFYLKYEGLPSDSPVWDGAYKEFSEIMKKYNSCTMCSRLMLAVWFQLEEECKLH